MLSGLVTSQGKQQALRRAHAAEGESMVFTYGPYETMAKAKRAQGNLVSPDLAKPGP